MPSTDAPASATVPTIGKPILGACLGALAAVFVVVILQQGGILPPERLVLFGLLGLGIGVGAFALSTAFKARPFLIVQAIAVLFLGFALSGIPAFGASGYITGGCYVDGETPEDAATPDETSVSEPFIIDRAGPLDWYADSPGVFTDWQTKLSLDVGGFAVPVWSGTHPNDGRATDWGKVEDIGEYVEDVKGATGLTLSGVYHLYGSLVAGEGSCTMSAYIVIPPTSLFAGPLLLGSWIGLAAVLGFGTFLTLRTCRVRKGLSIRPELMEPRAE